MVNFKQKIDGLVLAVLSNVKRDNHVNKIEQVIGSFRRLCLRASHPFLAQFPPQRAYIAVTCAAVNMEHTRASIEGRMIPQDSKSFQLPFSLNDRDSLESFAAIDMARTLSMSASKVLLEEAFIVEYNAFRTS